MSVVSIEGTLTYVIPPECRSALQAMLPIRRPVKDALGTSKPITIIVGSGEALETFYPYEHLITKHSPYFTTALHKEWKEGQERSVPLDDINPEYFAIFFHFINTGVIHSMGPAAEFNPDKQTDLEWTRLGRCYLLADRLMSTTFQDAIVDAFIQKIIDKGCSPTLVHETIYSGTARQSGMRRLLVDIAIFEWDKDILATRAARPACADFFKDLAVRYQEILEKGGEQEGAPYRQLQTTCQYHDHGQDEECCRMMFEYI